MEKNPNIPQLFRDIFNNAYLPYRDPETLKMFLKTIGEFEYTHSEKLGDAFEYLLQVMGSQGDAGQFRTPRHIIDFLVAIVDPGKNDTILDPACGTAGFLISAYKHILLKNAKANEKGLDIYSYNNKNDKPPFNNLGDNLTPDQKKKLVQNFAGYDISPDMVRLSLVNLYLHGFPEPHVHEYDTLSSEARWNENFDVILANPPFMSPKGGIRPHKKFTISSKRSEVLFVDYIAEHLNPKGRAGIIVPEGVIFQSGTAYKDLRKMLIENQLYAVVSLPAGVFNPYSGVKTSILLLDAEIAKKSNEVLFIKIKNDGYNLGAQRTAMKGGQLEEAIITAKAFKNLISKGEDFANTSFAHSVYKKEIAKSGEYNLNGDRYKNIDAVNSKFEFVKLSEICDVRDGTHDSPKYVENGYPLITSKNIKDGYIDFSNVNNISEEDLNRVNKRSFVDDGDIIMPMIGTIGNPIVVKKEQEFAIKNLALIKFEERSRINNHYLKAVLASDYFSENYKNFSSGSTQKFISLTFIRNLEIPLPPLPIQEEIVAEIEGYQKIIDGAKAVVENYKPKIEIDPKWEMVEFKDAPLEIIDGDRGKNYPKKSDFNSEGFCLFLSTKNVRDNGFLFEDLSFISEEKDKALRKGKLDREDVLLTTRGTVGNTAYYDSSVAYNNIRINSGMLIFRTEQNKLLPEYLYYFFQSENCKSQFKKIISGAAQPQLPIRSLKNAYIPIPTPEIQIKIVNKIKKELTLVDANHELIEIFKQKIKDRIAKIWGE
ncbi:N-6 DNA methylase [Salegentibacter mishustinae]